MDLGGFNYRTIHIPAGKAHICKKICDKVTLLFHLNHSCSVLSDNNVVHMHVGSLVSCLDL